MIEFFEVMFRALTGLKLNMSNLIIIFAFFAMGYGVSKFAKNIGVLKALVLLIVGYFIASILSSLLGVFTLAFILGFLSNQSMFLYRVMMWAESLSEIYYSLQHKGIFEDIQSRERELEEEIARLREELRRQQQQKTREKPSSKTNNQRSQSRSSGAGSEKAKAQQKQSQTSQMDRYLKVLGLEAGQSYTEKEIRKAYRRMAMKLHPDMPNGNQAAFVELGEALEYLLKKVG